MIDGLSIRHDWIGVDEEAKLLEQIGGPGRPARTVERNRIERYGPGVVGTGYATGQKVELEIPPYLATLARRLADEGVIEPDAISVNWYLPGQFMRPHVDRAQAGDVIPILSLAGPCVMRFLAVNKGSACWFECPPRTLVIMAGTSRWHYKHEILPVSEPRASIVFRRAKP